MDTEDRYRKERIKINDGTTIDITVSEDDVLIEEENGSILYAGSNWIRLNWKDWNEVMKVVRRLKSNRNKKNKEFVREKKIKGLHNRREEIKVRLIDHLIEIEDMIIKNEEVDCVGNIYLYEEEWEKLKKCVDELIDSMRMNENRGE